MVSLLSLGVVLWLVYPYWVQWRLRKLARDLFATLNDLEIEYWADFGTLLGIYREGDIILGDNDVDVCLPNTNNEALQRLAENLSHAGYRIDLYKWRTISRVYDSLWGGPFADLYHVQRSEAENVYKGATGPNSDIPVNLIGDTIFMTWQCGETSIPVCVPADVPGVLRWRYGDDYMTPRPNFKGRDSH